MRKIFWLFMLFCSLNALDSATNKQSSAIIDEVKNIIKDRFETFYKPYNIRIDSLTITPTIAINIDKMKLEKVVFDDKDIKKDSGNIEVHLYRNEKRQRVFFTFNINASIEALSATNSIKSNEVITASNTTITRIPINRNMQLPVSSEILDEYSAKSFISSGSIITQNKITPKIVISKGDTIEVAHNDDNISIIFNAKALEDGAKGQTIKAQNSQSGKNIEIIIINQKSAVLK